MKHRVLFIIALLLFVASQPVLAQSKSRKVVQDMNDRREKRERQAATLQAKVNEQKAQQAAEKKPVDLPLPAADGSNDNQQAAPATSTANRNAGNQLPAAGLPGRFAPKVDRKKVI